MDPPIPAHFLGDAATLDYDDFDELVGRVLLAEDTGLSPADAIAALAARSDAPKAAAWTVADDDAAEWALRKLATIRAQREVLAERARVWSDQIAEWLRAEDAPLEARDVFLTGRLEAYAVGERASGRKSVRLPSGSVSTRPVEAGFVVVDQDRLVRWLVDTFPAEAVDGAIKRTVLVSGLRDLLPIVEWPLDLVEIELVCGHTITVGRDDEGVFTDVAEAVCPTDGPQSIVRGLPVSEPAVVNPADGERVDPELIGVRPARTSATVKLAK